MNSVVVFLVATRVAFSKSMLLDSYTAKPAIWPTAPVCTSCWDKSPCLMKRSSCMRISRYSGLTIIQRPACGTPLRLRVRFAARASL